MANAEAPDKDSSNAIAASVVEWPRSWPEESGLISSYPVS